MAAGYSGGTNIMLFEEGGGVRLFYEFLFGQCNQEVPLSIGEQLLVLQEIRLVQSEQCLTAGFHVVCTNRTGGSVIYFVA